MGTGWTRIGLPIRTLPGAAFSPLPPAGAAGTGAEWLPPGAPWDAGALQMTSTATFWKP